MFENETCYIFLDINLNYREIQFLENNSEEKIEICKNYILYKYATKKAKLLIVGLKPLRLFPIQLHSKNFNRTKRHE
jgi:hypothetical protein